MKCKKKWVRTDGKSELVWQYGNDINALAVNCLSYMWEATKNWAGSLHWSPWREFPFPEELPIPLSRNSWPMLGMLSNGTACSIVGQIDFTHGAIYGSVKWLMRLVPIIAWEFSQLSGAWHHHLAVTCVNMHTWCILASIRRFLNWRWCKFSYRE